VEGWLSGWSLAAEALDELRERLVRSQNHQHSG